MFRARGKRCAWRDVGCFFCALRGWGADGSIDGVVDRALDVYDVPFVPTMFLVEKKMLYLKFLGANRVVMHRILD